MATRLKAFDFNQPSELTTSEKANYPWEDWFDGDIWQITQGEDFETHPLMMERIIRTRASAPTRKAKVRVKHQPLNGDPWGIIVLQRTDIDGPNEIKRKEAAAKRAAKKAQADVEAEQIVKGLKTGRHPANKRAAKTTAAPSKRPAKQPPRKLAAV